MALWDGQGYDETEVLLGDLLSATFMSNTNRGAAELKTEMWGSDSNEWYTKDIGKVMNEIRLEQRFVSLPSVGSSANVAWRPANCSLRRRR
jgi:hypothetical protein